MGATRPDTDAAAATCIQHHQLTTPATHLPVVLVEVVVGEEVAVGLPRLEGHALRAAPREEFHLRPAVCIVVTVGGWLVSR